MVSILQSIIDGIIDFLSTLTSSSIRSNGRDMVSQSTIQPFSPDIERIQETVGAREKLEEIQTQIQQAEITRINQQIEFVQGEIQKARAFQSELQADIRPTALSRTAADTYARLGSLQAAFEKLSGGSYKQQLQAGTIRTALINQQLTEKIRKINPFISQAQEQISLLRLEKEDFV